MDKIEKRNGMTHAEFQAHPCIVSQGEEDGCGACYAFPHPGLKCSEDGHMALQITNLKQVLDSLYEKCPKRQMNEHGAEPAP